MLLELWDSTILTKECVDIAIIIMKIIIIMEILIIIRREKVIENKIFDEKILF